MKSQKWEKKLGLMKKKSDNWDKSQNDENKQSKNMRQKYKLWDEK